MAKSEARARASDVLPGAFVAAMQDSRLRQDAEVLLHWMTRVTGP